MSAHNLSPDHAQRKAQRRAAAALLAPLRRARQERIGWLDAFLDDAEARSVLGALAGCRDRVPADELDAVALQLRVNPETIGSFQALAGRLRHELERCDALPQPSPDNRSAT